jgi:hypothetical protein
MCVLMRIVCHLLIRIVCHHKPMELILVPLTHKLSAIRIPLHPHPRHKPCQ